MKLTKKVLLVFVSLLVLVGCGNMMNTPTKKVEAFLNKYQTQNKDVLNQLDDVIDQAGTLNDDQREKYRELMKKQYQNLNYKIKEETEDGNNATVVVEIEVYDYGKALSNSEKYLADNREDFITNLKDDTIDTVKFLDYKINQMTNTKDKVTYTINFTLTKVDGKWKLNDISDIDRQKLHGLYY